MPAPLAEVSVNHGERTRKTIQLVLQRVSRIGQTSIARTTGLDEATISRIKNERLEQVVQFVLAAGLKIVPADMKCFDSASIAAILQLAKERMAQIETTEQLQWGDE